MVHTYADDRGPPSGRVTSTEECSEPQDRLGDPVAADHATSGVRFT